MEREIRDEIITQIQKEQTRICSNILDFDSNQYFSKNTMSYLADRCFESSIAIIKDVFLNKCCIDK